MSIRLDVIVFGATGYTGKWAVAEVNRQAKLRTNFKWGIAGRSNDKLKNVIAELEKNTGDDLSHVEVIIADVNDDESLNKMAARTKLVVNTAGPYRFYGEPVVKACVLNGTHQVDVSGEPQYMERMQLEYHKKAEEKGVFILSACGFDSIPSDLGVIFVQNNFDGTVNSVETYLESGGVSSSGSSINYGTWHSAVYGLAHANELKTLRRQLYPERLPKFKPTLEKRGVIHKSDVINKWCLPFLGSDRSVVLRSQRYLYENANKRPVQVETYMGIKSIFTIVLLTIFAGIFGILCRFDFGRSLLLKYPRFFSGGFFSTEEPTLENVVNSYFRLTLYAKGWTSDKKLSDASDQQVDPPNKTLTARVSGKNPGYGLTAMALVMSGLTILDEKDKLPGNGGVLPPGAVFANTSLIQKLIDNGMNFEIVDVKVD